MTSANYRVSKTPEKSAFNNFFRQKPHSSHKPHRRRISCKDLGGGDCNGWLKMKTTRSGRLWNSSNWTKYWFVLKTRCLYYYKQPEDDSYLGRFQLSGFQVSPADHEKHDNLFAFRIHHAEHGTFLMASDRRQDMAKWMNRLLLATLDPNPNPDNVEYGCFSGGEEDDDDDGGNAAAHSTTTTPKHCGASSATSVEFRQRETPTSSHSPERCPTSPAQDVAIPPTDNGLDGWNTASPVPDEFSSLVKAFRLSRICGTNNIRGSFRSSMVSGLSDRSSTTVASASAAIAADNSTATSTACHFSTETSLEEKRSSLLAKKRTLKDKEAQLKAIEDLFNALPVEGSAALARFQQIHPEIGGTEKVDGPGTILERLV